MEIFQITVAEKSAPHCSKGKLSIFSNLVAQWRLCEDCFGRVDHCWRTGLCCRSDLTCSYGALDDFLVHVFCCDSWVAIWNHCYFGKSKLKAAVLWERVGYKHFRASLQIFSWLLFFPKNTFLKDAYLFFFQHWDGKINTDAIKMELQSGHA